VCQIVLSLITEGKLFGTRKDATKRRCRAAAPPPQIPQNGNVKIQDFVDTMV